MKRALMFSAAAAALVGLADPADPQVSNVQISQDEQTRKVTVTYELDEPAIVTMDVLTNDVSIGAKNIWCVTGDCNRRVEAGPRAFAWSPTKSWPGHRFDTPVVSVRVTAWATNCPPDYLVVDLTSSGGAGTERWYTSAESLPGGLLANESYRTSLLVLRKINAKGVTWTMGDSSESWRSAGWEDPHTVTLDRDYYIGVFPVTQAQWAHVKDASISTRQWPSHFTNMRDRAMRPVENVYYAELRECKDSWSENAKYRWPAPPFEDSFMGVLRKKTGLAFDLPSEAQWEFACKAGHGEGMWGNGVLYGDLNDDPNMPGRHQKNGGYKNGAEPPADCSADCGTAIVGSYAPNDWGLYDMHGNVCEWCLDWQATDITKIGGAVNVDPEHPENCLSTKAAGQNRVARGGGWNYQPGNCRATRRADGWGPAWQRTYAGIRLVYMVGNE